MKKKILFEPPMLPFEEFGVPPELAAKPVRMGAPVTEDRLLYYMSFGSGSSGNSAYIGTRNGGLIVDAGVRADVIEARLKACGIPMSHVKGILLTHDHADHVRSTYTLLRNNRHMKVFCGNRTLEGILKRTSISKRIREYHVPIFLEHPFRMLEFEITPFDVPHDSFQNFGFSIAFDNRNFVIATDVGQITDRIRHYAAQADYLVLESNYDRQMLISGSYPEYLKARIMGGRGHLDNAIASAFLKEIRTARLRHVFLCHLSKDNNTPAKALKATRDALEESGIKIGRGENSVSDRQADLQLCVLPRFDSTPLFVLRP